MRSGQKDTELTSTHLHPLVKRAADSLSKLLHSFQHDDSNGGSVPLMFDWMQWASEVEVLTNLLYYVITTVSGQQTIGEEYVNIIQVGASGKHQPRVILRLFMVGLHCLAPYIVSKLVSRLRMYVNTNLWMVESRKPLVNDCLEASDKVFQWIYKIHRSLFFLGLSNENVSKLISSVGYVTIRQTSVPPYQWFTFIGYLGVLQAAVNALQGLKKLRQRVQVIRSSEMKVSQQSEGTKTTQQQISKYRCPLCYDSFTNITSTPCGHLFCWGCVYPWTCAKSCCPVCREDCEPKRLILLVNFELWGSSPILLQGFIWSLLWFAQPLILWMQLQSINKNKSCLRNFLFLIFPAVDLWWSIWLKILH